MNAIIQYNRYIRYIRDLLGAISDSGMGLWDAMLEESL